MSLRIKLEVLEKGDNLRKRKKKNVQLVLGFSSSLYKFDFFLKQKNILLVYLYFIY